MSVKWISTRDSLFVPRNFPGAPGCGSTFRPAKANNRKLRAAALFVLVAMFGVGGTAPALAATRSVSITVLPTQSVAPGGTARYPFVVRTKGPVGAVSFGVSGVPEGASATVTSGGGGGFELAVDIPANAPPSLSTITIRTRSLAAAKSAVVYLEVLSPSTPRPVATVPPTSTPPTIPTTPPTQTVSFTLRADNPEITVPSGVTAAFGISVDRSLGYGGDVVFSAAGIPAGVNANFAPNPTRGGSVLYATASAGVPDGRYTITIKGAADALNVKFTSVILVVQNVVDFALDVPPTAIVAAGATTNVPIGFKIIGSSAPTVSLGVNGLPPGVSANFVPNPTFGKSTLVFTAATTAVPGAYVIGIVGSFGGIIHSYPMTLLVTGGPVGGFGLSASPTAISTPRGTTASFSLSVLPTGGFASDIAWTVSGLPVGVTMSISGVRPNLVVVVSVPANTTPGGYILTLTGTSGSLVASVPVTLTIT
jgi:hypothetical protein